MTRELWITLFKIGETVLLRNFVSRPVWLCGVVVCEHGPCLIDVRLGDGRELRQHRDHIRKRAEVPNVADESEMSSFKLEFLTPSPTLPESEHLQTTAQPSVADSLPPLHCSMREH